jgi:ribose 5-phosphate isomerase B
MGVSEESIRDMVRRVLLRTLGPNGIPPSSGDLAAPSTRGRAAITELQVQVAPRGGTLPVPPDAIVTPLALDAAFDRGVELVQEPGAEPKGKTPPSQEQPSRTQKGAVALGADHGGFPLKEDLKKCLGELGYAVLDCGTHTKDAVDYPDVAYAVATAVASGRASRGIMVDGAGIGSCMAANKVPGIRAAMCYDHATAVNSREHNDANVLTLGGTLIGANLARQIVKVWLETEFGGGRHARRVDKIMAIERRFVK